MGLCLWFLSDNLVSSTCEATLEDVATAISSGSVLLGSPINDMIDESNIGIAPAGVAADQQLSFILEHTLINVSSAAVKSSDVCVTSGSARSSIVLMT